MGRVRLRSWGMYSMFVCTTQVQMCVCICFSAFNQFLCEFNLHPNTSVIYKRQRTWAVLCVHTSWPLHKHSATRPPSRWLITRPVIRLTWLSAALITDTVRVDFSGAGEEGKTFPHYSYFMDSGMCFHSPPCLQIWFKSSSNTQMLWWDNLAMRTLS